MTHLATLTAAVKALADPYVEVIPITRTVSGRQRQYLHHGQFDSLLNQLAEAVIPGTTGTALTAGYESQPPARLDAIDRLLAIQAGAAMWALRLGLTPVDDTADQLRRLAQAATEDNAQALTVDVHRWTTWARVATGWDTPPWTPPAPCPACDRKALRVRMDTLVGICMECGETWDADTIGILAEHIKAWQDAREQRSRSARTAAVAMRRRAEGTA